MKGIARQIYGQVHLTALAPWAVASRLTTIVK